MGGALDFGRALGSGRGLGLRSLFLRLATAARCTLSSLLLRAGGVVAVHVGLGATAFADAFLQKASPFF